MLPADMLNIVFTEEDLFGDLKKKAELHTIVCIHLLWVNLEKKNQKNTVCVGRRTKIKLALVFFFKVNKIIMHQSVKSS